MEFLWVRKGRVQVDSSKNKKDENDVSTSNALDALA